MSNSYKCARSIKIYGKKPDMGPLTLNCGETYTSETLLNANVDELILNGYLCELTHVEISNLHTDNVGHVSENEGKRECVNLVSSSSQVYYGGKGIKKKIQS